MLGDVLFAPDEGYVPVHVLYDQLWILANTHMNAELHWSTHFKTFPYEKANFVTLPSQLDLASIGPDDMVEEAADLSTHIYQSELRGQVDKARIRWLNNKRAEEQRQVEMTTTLLKLITENPEILEPYRKLLVDES